MLHVFDFTETRFFVGKLGCKCIHYAAFEQLPIATMHAHVYNKQTKPCMRVLHVYYYVSVYKAVRLDSGEKNSLLDSHPTFLRQSHFVILNIKINI